MMVLRKAIAICWMLLFLVNSQTIAQQNYLKTTYDAAGGETLLANLNNWRAGQKASILTSVNELPETVKKQLIASADNALAQPWPLLRLSDYSEYRENGNRVNFEHLYLSRRSKLSVLCTGELADGKGKYLPEIANGVWLLLEETSWVLPAHLYNKNNTTGPDPTAPIIDLFAAETAAQLSWIKLLLSDQLNKITPLLVKRIDAELNTRIIKPYMVTNNYWWQGFDKQRQNNWNIWINSNLLKVSALADNDPAGRAAMINKVIRSADNFLEAYEPDGGCDEGPAYWSAAGGCLGEFLYMLNNISAGKLSCKNNQLIHNIGTYIYKAHIEGTRFVNFADAPAFTLPDAGRVFVFGSLYNDGDMKGFAAYLAGLNKNASSYLNAGSLNSFANLVQLSRQLKATAPKAPLLKENWLPDVQVVNLRIQSGGSKGLSFMAKGGNNAESHNHNDIGNFMLYSNGEPVLIDLGKGTYNKQTFGPDRYTLWYMQSGWHNCPAINGIDQKNGPAFKATNVKYKAGNSSIFSLNLAASYPKAAAVKSWTREFTYDRSKAELTLKEDFELNEYKAPSKLSFMACKKPVQVKEGGIRLTAFTDKPAALMTYDPKLFDVAIEERPTDDGSLNSVWGSTIYRIVLTTKSQALKGKHTIKFKAI